MSLRSSRKRKQRERAARMFGAECQFVVGEVREMAQADLLAEIPEAELAAIRAEDPHPLILAIDVAQEGESTGEMVINGQSAGGQKKLWPAAAIRDFAEKLKSAATRGLAKFWHGDHDNKREAGRIIKTIVKTVGDKAHAIAIGWIHDAAAKQAFRDGKVSTGSMEAECQFERDGSSWIVRAVKAVQGIVLAGGGLKPGFPGATVLASVQELKTEDEEMPNDAPVTLRDVQDVIKENGWTPAQIFGAEVILKDPVVVGAIKTEVEGKVEAADKKSAETIKKLEADAKAWARHQVNQTAGDLIANSAKLASATKGTAAFVIKALTGRIDLSGVADGERQAAVDKAIDEQLAFIEDTGITVPEPKADDKGGKADKGGSADGANKTGTAKVTLPGGVEGVTLIDGKDMTNPADNPQIPK